MNPNSNRYPLQQWSSSPSSAKKKTPSPTNASSRTTPTHCHPPSHSLSDIISSLVAKEQKNFPNLHETYLNSARKEAIEWTRKTSAHHGFSALTVLLAVNYLDRCFLSPNGLVLQEDKPWMMQLSSVACLSLEAKVEETYVPLLVDLQINPSDVVTGFVFELKTIKRMELLVLSTLQWKMTPTTALNFVQCILSKMQFFHDPVEILRQCDAILLSVGADWRWVRFPLSEWAAAALMQANVMVFDELQQLMEVLEISKDRVEECYMVIAEVMGGESNKRKKRCYCSSSEPPNGVIFSCFSYESSFTLDSWTMWPSSLSFSPEPPPAKRQHFG